MPANDGTGPMGQGPKTGRGMGSCSSDGGASQPNVFFGRGMGFGCRGCRFGWGANAIPSLEEQEAMLEERLANIRQARKTQKKQ